MDLIQLKDFFHLSDDLELFSAAIKPPSCGGGEIYETLAIEGDNILDANLLKLFTQMNVSSKGELTKRSQEFHNNRTLTKIGIEIELQKVFSPIDSNYVIQEKDIKETIEALIGASERYNTGEFSFEIVENLYKIALENDYIDIDYISELQKLIQNDPEFQNKQRNQPVGSVVKPLNWEKTHDQGNEIAHAWIIDLSVEYQGKPIHSSSESFPNKPLAQRDAAKKIFQQIFGISFTSEKKININSDHEVMMHATQSFSQREIVFSKAENSDSEDGPMKISVDTGKFIADWAQQKAKKNPYGMLLLLSARLPNEIHGSSWNASMELGELILLNLQLQDQNYFEVGYGTSKSQARKNAATKIIETCNLFQWLNEHHGNEIK